MRIRLGYWSDENNSWRTIFNQKLLAERIEDGLGLLPIFGLLILPILMTFQCNFPKEIIHIHKIIEGAPKRLLAINLFRLIVGGVRILNQIRVINLFLIRFERTKRLFVSLWGLVVDLGEGLAGMVEGMVGVGRVVLEGAVALADWLAGGLLVGLLLGAF